MSKVDRLKEEIGWLKLFFGAIVAVDAPLIAWVVRNYHTAGTALTVVSVMIATLFRTTLLFTKWYVYNRLKHLEQQ